MEPAIIPVIILMIMLTSQNWSPGGWELIIILIIALILLGANRLPDIARGMGESIRNFKTGMPCEQRQQSSDSRRLWLLILTVVALAVTLPVLSLNIFSNEQETVLMVALLVWIAVGHWSFGRTLRKRDDR